MSDEGPADDGPFPRKLETARLRLRRLTADEIPPEVLYDYLGAGEDIDRETRHLLWDPHESVEYTREFLAKCDEVWESGHRATYFLQREDGPESPRENFLGMCSLIVEEDPSKAMPGVYLRREYWGEGYAMERAEALIELAFETLAVELVESICLDGNDRARSHVEKYVERYGGEYAGLKPDYVYDESGDQRDCHCYRITAEQYRNATE